jgi:hypothetical protein
MAMTFETAEKMDLRRPDSFPVRNMADVHVAVAAHIAGVEMWCLEREKPMAKASEEVDHEKDSIWAHARGWGLEETEMRSRINLVGLQPRPGFCAGVR